MSTYEHCTIIREHTLYHNACIITANFLMTGLQDSKLIEDICAIKLYQV